MNKGGWVYIVTNKPNGTLYIGVTNDLSRRSWEHAQGKGSHFTQRHQCHLLVWYTQFDEIQDAIAHEKRMKMWSREVKIKTIIKTNPTWANLYPTLTE